jgi:Icc-related predicted phosphoesterase
MDVQITCLANIHNNKLSAEALPSSDILVIAGGGTNKGTHAEYKQFTNSLADWSKNFEHIVYVPGKSDTGLHEYYWKYYDMLTEIHNITILVNTDVILKGVKIWGSCATRHDPTWSYTLKEKQLINHYEKIPSDIDVLVTQMPPEGIMDIATQKRNISMNVGCKYVSQAIERIKPKLHIFSGAYESYGEVISSGVTYINASLIDEDRQPTNEIQVVRVKPRKEFL